MLHGRIDHVQTSWVKLGVEGTRRMLRGGADDLGGTLMEETISRMAGADNGSEKTIAELEQMVTAIGRTPRQRTTEYGEPSAERVETAAPVRRRRLRGDRPLAPGPAELSTGGRRGSAPRGGQRLRSRGSSLGPTCSCSQSTSGCACA